MDKVKGFRIELTKMFVGYTLAVLAVYFAITFFELDFAPSIITLAALCALYVYFRERLDKYCPPGNFLKYYLRFCYPLVLIDTIVDLTIVDIPSGVSLLIELVGFSALYVYMYHFYAAKIAAEEELTSDENYKDSL